MQRRSTDPVKPAQKYDITK